MNPRSFTQNILAVAVLSAISVSSAYAADFNDDAYVNTGSQDTYSNFVVKNNAVTNAAVMLRGSGTLTVNDAFNVQATGDSQLLAGVGIESASLTLEGDATILVKNTYRRPLEGDLTRAKGNDTFGLLVNGSTVKVKNLGITVEAFENTEAISLYDGMMTADSLMIKVSSENRTATGISMESVTEDLSGGSLTVNQKALIEANGVNARGLALHAGGAIFNGVTTIKTVGQEASYGIFLMPDDNATATFNDRVVIHSTVTNEASKESANAVYAYGGSVVMKGGAEILSDGAAIYATNAGTVSIASEKPTAVTAIVGDVLAGQGATVNLTLQHADTLKGALVSEGTIKLDLKNGATWTVTDKSTVTKLTSTDGRLAFTSPEATLTIKESFKATNGTTAVFMNSLPAKGGAYITATNSASLEGKVRAVMSGDFNDAYIGTTDEAVKAAANAVFGETPASSATVTEVSFDEGRLSGAIEASRNDDGTFAVTQKANTKMEALKTLSVLSGLQWRHDMNDLTKRMGDLRTSPEGLGGWARVYGSEQAYDDVVSKNTSVQVGGDVDVGQGWKVGAAMTYTDGSADLTNGTADQKAYGLAAYGTWLGDDGHFVDLIAKVSRLKTDFEVSHATGRFDNNAWSLSAEVGRHFTLANNAFVEPQVELTYGRILSDDFDNSEGVRIEQDDFESLIGRMGVRAGFYFPNDKGLIYARASVLHDFKGESGLVASYGQKRVAMSDDMGGTWGEFGLGATFRLTPATYTYVDLEKTTNSDVHEKWRWNLGVRYVY